MKTILRSMAVAVMVFIVSASFAQDMHHGVHHKKHHRHHRHHGMVVHH